MTHDANASSPEAGGTRRDADRYAAPVPDADILVVEDAPDTSLLISGALRAAGHRVRCAASMVEALDSISAAPPDLIVLDLTLPDGDGLDLCRTIRDRSSAYVLMLSGRDDEIDKLLGFRLGADDYVTKPFSPRELVARVEALLRRPRSTADQAAERRVGDVVIRTIAREVEVDGQRVELTLRPAAPDTGIVFRRIDLPEPVDIKVSAAAVTDTRMASTLSCGNAKVLTVEHLMSACAGLGVDNLYVDITAEEVPILDGSAASFVFLLQSAGIVLQNAPRRFIRLLKPVEVRDGQGASEKWARLEPYHGYKLSFEIDFDHPAVDSTGQRVVFDMSTDSYSKDIARARTFGFTKDVEMMRANGLALGGGMDNAIVMDDYKVLNAGGLRYDDEFVKHKILDAMGDLYLVGKPFLASYSAFRSGHGLNNLLLRELLKHPEAWDVVTFEDDKRAPKGFAQLARAW